MVTRLLPVPLWLALLITSAVVTPASAAQFRRLLEPLFDEDFLKRIPGPDVGDDAGLPITGKTDP